MTSSRTILIETNRLFRDGLKHLLNGTRFEVGAEFNTVDLALDRRRDCRNAGPGDQWPSGDGRS